MPKLDESRACEACRKRVGTGSAINIDKKLEGLKETGKEFVPGPSRTYYTDWVCPDCGHEWTEIVDRGRGGYGHFLHPGHMR